MKRGSVHEMDDPKWTPQEMGGGGRDWGVSLLRDCDWEN